jgi:hypothetical protein
MKVLRNTGKLEEELTPGERGWGSSDLRIQDQAPWVTSIIDVHAVKS